jgi:hypothetical protein
MSNNLAPSPTSSTLMAKQNSLKLFFGTLALLITLAQLCTPASAAEPTIWEINSRAELLRGDARGVSITDSGVLMLAPRVTQLFNTDQPYIWSSAADGAGNIYLGTGHDGRLYRVGRDGRGARHGRG